MKDAVLRDIIQRITAEFSPEKIYLFGSRARGDFDEESDYDILVVADMPGIDKKKRAYHIRRLFPLRDFGLDVVVKSPEEFESRRELLNHICHEVNNEGVVVYGG